MTHNATPRAIRILLDEHEEGHRYLDPLADLPRTAAALAADDLQRALTVASDALAYLDGPIEEHIAKEEEPLFPALKARLPADDRLIDEMIAEHDYVRMYRDDLRAAIDEILGGHDDVRSLRDGLRTALDAATAEPGAATIETLLRAARKVAETALVHFENEEDLVFPLAPQLLDGAELDAIAAAMDEIARRYAARR